MASSFFFALALLTSSALAADLARPIDPTAERLSASPNLWLTRGFLSPETVEHMRSMVPKDEAAYSPCIGQVDQFDSKRCTILPVRGNPLIEAALAKIEHAWDVDTTRLLAEGLPIIRYLPGAPAVGKHGDEDRHGIVPNATLVLYLTNSDRVEGAPSGQTVFPEADVRVTPRQGSILSFQNVDEHGARHPLAKHTVDAVPAEAKRDRIVVQIPIAHRAGMRAYAYPEHVSGGKKPGQHEKMHGNADQKAAYLAAAAAGASIAVAFMAAKAGKFDPADVPELKKMAEDTGKFADEDFETPAPAQ
jgi:hypothetical protein